MVLAYVENIQEPHLKINQNLELLNLKDAKYKICGDLKIINIFLGLSGHSGKFLCAQLYNMYEAAGCPVKKMRLY